MGSPPARVFEVLADPAGYPRWWPGAKQRPEGRLVLPGLGSVAVEATDVRPGVGLFVQVAGQGFSGHVEWFLEPYKEGTVVNGIVNVESAGRWRERRILAVRAGLRSAMVALHALQPLPGSEGLPA
ncbi:MAG: hypothetical protein M3Q23_03415 [Actinomycetota bacterium]|nr:hypothetical protein [Actinomycetota bacterium]